MFINTFGSNQKTDINKIENRYNLQLPKDYFDFLCDVGGGVVEKTKNEVFIKGSSDNITVDVLFGIDTQYKNANISTWNDKYIADMPENTLIIGDTLEHGFLVLLCSGDEAGLYYWDDTYYFPNSNDEANTYFIADTFTDFIKQLL